MGTLVLCGVSPSSALKVEWHPPLLTVKSGPENTYYVHCANTHRQIMLTEGTYHFQTKPYAVQPSSHYDLRRLGVLTSDSHEFQRECNDTEGARATLNEHLAEGG